MTFVPSRRQPMRPPRESCTVFAVGQRAFVHGPAVAGRLVTLTDQHGTIPQTALEDGVEVQVLAWRPRGSSGTRYRVREATGVDGWLAADELRTTAVRPPEAAPEPPSAMQYGRPFGSGR